MTRAPNNIHWTPLDEEFDAAIMTISRMVLPDGFDVAPIAPGTFQELNELMAKTKRMRVWSGGSETTIYGSPEINFNFRAWHDHLHWLHQLPFTFAGEAAVICEQVEQLRQTFPNHRNIKLWCALLFAEVIGQQLYNDLHGSFPGNQRAFVKKFIAVLLEQQATLPVELRETGSPSMANEPTAALHAAEQSRSTSPPSLSVRSKL